MNISILSMQNVNNTGSLLQAYSLKKSLSQLGHKVSFISIESNPEDQYSIQGHIYDQSYECDKGKKLDRYFFTRFANKLKQRKQFELFKRFRDNYLQDETQPNAHNDLCIIGSDEVFNCLSPSPWGLSRQLFGDVKDAKKVITYAASCGATVIEDVPEQAREIIRGAMSNITGFSARDNNTIHFIKELGFSNVYKHLDPVLIYDFLEEIKGKDTILKELPRKYCILYSYHNRIHKKDEIAAIKKFAEENKLELITVGQSQYWLNNHYVLDPFSVIVAFKNAEFVVTDTYHGCIMAAKYSDKYAIMTRESNYNKLKDLIDTLHIGRYMINSMNELRMCPNDDKTQIISILEKEREKSLKYLEDEILK